MRTSVALTAAALTALFSSLHAQDKGTAREPGRYKVELDIRDPAAAHSDRHYSLVIVESRPGVFEAANRIPLAASPSSAYVDAGVKIECTAHDSNGKVALRGNIEMTSREARAGFPEPEIGQRKITFDTSVELGTPTAILSDRHALPAAPKRLDGGGVTALAVDPGPKQVIEATVTKLD